MTCPCTLGRDRCNCGLVDEPIPTSPADLEDTRHETEGGALLAMLMLGLALVAAGYIVAELLSANWTVLP